MHPPKLHVETLGSGPTIVVSAGLTQTTANWRGLARQNQHLRWVLFDPRGQGRSEIGAQPYTLDDHVQDLRRVIASECEVAPVIAGFSHGGRVAIRFAALYPHDLRGLILVSTATCKTPLRTAHITSWAKCLELGGVEAMAWASLPTIVGLEILRKFHDLSMLVKGTALRNSKQGLLAMFEGMRSYPPAIDELERIKVPTLAFRGGQDPLVPAGDMTLLQERLASAETRTYPDCGHTLPLEEPDQFVNELTSFISGLDRRSQPAVSP